MEELILTTLGTVSPYSKGNKNCPGYLIEYKNKKVLLDCGNGITSCMKFPEDLKNLHVIISHFHPDHFGDITSVAQAALVYKRLGYIKNNITVHVPKVAKISEEHIFGGDDRDDWGHSEYIERDIAELEYLKSLASTTPIEIEQYNGYGSIDVKSSDITIKTYQTQHDIDAYAFKLVTDIGTICYSGDTGYDTGLIDFIKDADLFICESTFLIGQARINNNHLYAHEAGEIAKLANVKKLLLTHFWPEIDKEKYVEEAKEVFENTEALEEGKQLVLRR